MYVLGIATMTDSAAVLLHDGKVVAAVEEERLTRVKHQPGFPARAIRWVLESQRITLADVDHVAVYWNPWQVGYRLRHLAETLLVDPGVFGVHVRRAVQAWSGHGSRAESAGWSSLFRLGATFRGALGSVPRRIHFLDHHQCHAASCFYGSPFDDAAVLIMDGSGESVCTTAAYGQGSLLRTLAQHRVPHSLGHYYSAVTGYLGFQIQDGEYKVMGLSPCGDPAGAQWIRRHWLRTPAPGRYRLERRVLDYHRALRGDFRGAFVRRFGAARDPTSDGVVEPRYADVAASAQTAFEDVVLDLARHLRRATGAGRLTLAGGCGLNSAATGRILRDGVFDEVYVPPAPHDAGAALGAAMLLYARLTGRRPEPVLDARLGPVITADEARAAVREASGVVTTPMAAGELAQRVARSLAMDAVIAWARGPLEFGPRALGARSFLATPLAERSREILNEKIKKREPFRPFAPSVKSERAAEFFDLNQESPFMSLVVRVRPGKANVIPAVTHVDGTARPQTVTRADHPVFWDVLDQFERLTGVPVLLNTSFNIQEPIVCSARDALATFLRSGADALVLDDLWVERVADGAPNDRTGLAPRHAGVARP